MMKVQSNIVETAGAEQRRRAEARQQKAPWKKWDPTSATLRKQAGDGKIPERSALARSDAVL